MSHTSWERYISYYTTFDTDKNDPYSQWPLSGGPDWSTIKPSVIMGMSKYDKALKPIDPKLAVVELASYTYAGVDQYGAFFDVNPWSERPLAVGHPDFPESVSKSDDSYAEIKERVRELVGLAAYYSACALIYVLEKCDVRDKNTLDNRLGPYDEITSQRFTDVPHRVPQSWGEITAQRGMNKLRAKSSTRRVNLMLSTSFMVPLLAILIIPTLALKATQSKEKMAKDIEGETPYQ